LDRLPFESVHDPSYVPLGKIDFAAAVVDGFAGYE
jgi:hypothetical protein